MKFGFNCLVTVALPGCRRSGWSWGGRGTPAEFRGGAPCPQKPKNTT